MVVTDSAKRYRNGAPRRAVAIESAVGEEMRVVGGRGAIEQDRNRGDSEYAKTLNST